MAPPPPHPTLPKAAAPHHSDHFDPWNTSATGHQRAENRMSSSLEWRNVRTTKLAGQLQGGQGGGRARIYAGAEKSHGRDIRDMFGRSKEGKSRKDDHKDVAFSQGMLPRKVREETPNTQLPTTELLPMAEQESGNSNDGYTDSSNRRIFDGLVVYVNGSTYPAISDHKLKHLLAVHGAQMSIHLARRQVTHVILGRSNGETDGTGAGGGLSSSKIQKEFGRAGAKGVKYVNVEWVLQSVKAGKRLPEVQFASLKAAAQNQGSVYGMLTRSNAAR